MFNGLFLLLNRYKKMMRKKKDKSFDLSSLVDYPFQVSNLVRGLEALLEIG